MRVIKSIILFVGDLRKLYNQVEVPNFSDLSNLKTSSENQPRGKSNDA